MSKNITISLEVVDRFSKSLKSFKDAFIEASSTATDALQDVAGELETLRDSLDQLSSKFSNDLNKVSLLDLTVEIGTVVAAVVGLQILLKDVNTLLGKIGVRTITVLVSFSIGWDIGTWINDNIVIPFQKWAGDRDRNDVHRLLEQVLTPTDALDKLNAVYRKAGDDAQKFAALGVGAFETLRSRAIGEMEKLRSDIERLRFSPDMWTEAGRDSLERLREQLSQGEKLLAYLDKHRQAIHDLSGENNSLTATYDRLSKSVLDAAASFQGMSPEQLRGQIAGFQHAAELYREKLEGLTENTKTLFAGEWIGRDELEQKLFNITQKLDLAREKLNSLGVTIDKNNQIIADSKVLDLGFSGEVDVVAVVDDATESLKKYGEAIKALPDPRDYRFLADIPFTFDKSQASAAVKQAQELAAEISDTVNDLMTNFAKSADEARTIAFAQFGDDVDALKNRLASLGLSFDDLPPEVRKAFGDVEQAGADMQQFMLQVSQMIFLALTGGIGGGAQKAADDAVDAAEEAGRSWRQQAADLISSLKDMSGMFSAAADFAGIFSDAWGQALSDVANGIDSVASGLASIAQGGILNSITGGLSILSGVGSFIGGLFGFGGGPSEAEKEARRQQMLADAARRRQEEINRLMEDFIDKLKELVFTGEGVIRWTDDLSALMVQLQRRGADFSDAMAVIGDAMARTQGEIDRMTEQLAEIPKQLYDMFISIDDLRRSIAKMRDDIRGTQAEMLALGEELRFSVPINAVRKQQRELLPLAA